MPFAPWAAALAGFRLVRARPLAVLVWTLVIFAGRLAGLMLTTAISGPFMPALESAVNAKTINVQAVSVAGQEVAPGFAAGMALALPFFAVVFAAVYRAYLRPQEQRGFFLRLSAREGAMLALILVLNLALFVGVSFGAALVAAITAVAASADAGAGALVEVAGLAGLVAGTLWILVRLSLAWPMSFEAGRPVLFRSWALTQGRGWTLVGAYVVAEALMLVVLALLFSICASLIGAWIAGMGGTPNDVTETLHTPIAVREVFLPAPLLFSLFEALFLTLSTTTLVGVAVSAMRAFGPPGGAN